MLPSACPRLSPALLTAVLFRLAWSSAVFAAPVNLVANGSFETASAEPPSGTSLVLATGSTVMSGWTVTGHSIDYVSPVWTASDGDHCLDLNGNGPGGVVSDPVATTAGQAYDLVFDMAGNPDSALRLRTLRVLINGVETQRYSFDASSSTDANLGWRQKRLRFTAGTAQTTLAFETTTAGTYGPTLDNVGLYAANHAPTPPSQAAVTAAAPRAGRRLSASASGATDADGDVISYEYLWELSTDGGHSWYVRDRASTVRAGRTHAGEQWRFRARSRDWLEGSGWVTSAAVTIRPAPAAPLSLSAAASGPAAVTVALSAPATVQGTICNAAGRTVGMLAARSLPAGVHALPWSGRSQSGTLLPGGSYVVRLRASASDGSVAGCVVALRR